jgi:hypothetical protein
MEYLGYGPVRPTCFPGEDRGSLLAVAENSIPGKVEQSSQFPPILGFRLEKFSGPPSISDFGEPFPGSDDRSWQMGLSLLHI